MNPKNYVFLLILTITLSGCTKEVDFNQIDDAGINATYISTLIYANFSAINFLDTSNQEITYTTDFIEAPIDKSIIKYLEKVEFTVIINDTFNRGFNFYFNFFDETGQLVYILEPTIRVEPNSGETTFILEIPPEDIQVLNNTRFFGFLVELTGSTDGSTLSGTETATLDLKSSVKLFYNYRKI